MSKERKKYHVTYRAEDDKWQGKVEKAKRPSVVSDTKKDAMDRTIDLAKNHGHAQVFIHKKDGKIQEERTYGDDPSGSKG